MSELTVVTWLWKGWRPVYNALHVQAMCEMLKEYLTIPHRVVCITDNTIDSKSFTFEPYPLWKLGINFDHIPKGQPNSYVRLKMFSPWAEKEFPGRILSIDLDAVLFENIDSLITDDDLRINKGRACPYNGGMWLHRTGTRTNIWHDFSDKAPKLTRAKNWVGSDQAWIAYCSPGERVWTQEDGVSHYSIQAKSRVLPDKTKILFFAGSTKPWSNNLTRLMPNVSKQYHRFFMK